MNITNSVDINTLARLPFFFFNDTATTEIYTLSLHDALPISIRCWDSSSPCDTRSTCRRRRSALSRSRTRSEEHTSELQSRPHLVCRLLLEEKKKAALPALTCTTVSPVTSKTTRIRSRQPCPN